MKFCWRWHTFTVTGVSRSDTSSYGDTQEIRAYNCPFNFAFPLIYVGNGSVLNIAKDNRLDSLSLTTGKGGHINLQGAAIGSLKSSIHPESSVTLSGMEIK